MLNFLTLVSYFALVVDVVIQIIHIYRRKSSADISVIGSTIRGIALLVILFKFISVDDVVLIVSQAISVVIFAIYYGCIIKYNKPRNK